MAEHDYGKNKPLGIKLLSILSFALGFSTLSVAAFSLATGSDDIAKGIQILASLDTGVAAIVLLIFCVPFFIIGTGIWNLRGEVRTVLLAFALLGVVIYPLRLALIVSSVANNKWIFRTSDTVGLVVTIIGIPLSIVILFYLSRLKIILAFEGKEKALIKKKVRLLEERIEFGRQRCNAGEITKAEQSKLRADCLAEERVLKGKIRHFEKVRLGRERKIKESAEKKEKAKKEKEEKKEEKEARRKELRKKAKRKAKKEEEEGEKEAKKPKKKAKKGKVDAEEGKENKASKKERQETEKKDEEGEEA